jgi:hypothetical protein
VTATSWLESIKVAAGGEASWQGGELRFWIDRINIGLDRIDIERGWLARLLGRRDPPVVRTVCELGVRLATPDHPAFSWSNTTEFPAGFPMLLVPSSTSSYGMSFGHANDPFFAAWKWPYRDDGPLLAVQRCAMFEILEIVEDGTAAFVRAGFAETPPDLAIAGDLTVLDPAARRFVSWWLGQRPAERWAGARRGALGYPPIPGYALRLWPRSTGSLVTSFHRDGDRYLVRTYGGCVRPDENWYGPFVENKDDYRVSGGFRVDPL